ncbi:putative ubiquitin-conjugating enzyme E2 38 [Cornus florida]|uniref:putative ubiquitin-conjugating enzyme E2 38 n=1 Tax=Cornus florida TaxID=4283 RepID=UPI00289F78C5|nr:putative ubiquitin-conjugating enzyme E2 38 [Cornus florida]
MGEEQAASVTKQFRQFDVVTDYSDHEYAELKNPPINTGSATYKTIMKEWKVLRDSLPESIYVRVYEGRIDLLRAVIVGASGTPYHNGLFFFDFQFPPSYPDVPPQGHYKSFGLHLNPNLYDSGYICLSLLNTWPGPKWEPWRSTMLQVLVSLQALVLNEKPYFNEPLLLIWFEKLSTRYNNDVFVMSCKTMMFLLQKNPNNFEDFIVEHFRSHGRDILTACKVYTEGFATVGHYQNEDSFLPERVHVSSEFKDSMTWVYPRLVKAFEKIQKNGPNDPSLRNFISQLDLMIGKTKAEYIQKLEENKEENKKRMMKLDFFGKLKEIFGLNTSAESNAAGIEASLLEKGSVGTKGIEACY